MRRRWWWSVVWMLAVAAAVSLLYVRSRNAGWLQQYSPEELRALLEQARTFQDSLRVALQPAFEPLVFAYVQDKYRPRGVRVDIRRISVRPDGRFPVVAEVAGAIEGLYVQERFLFWWEGGRWNMRYVEGDL